jgi:tetratricopeptide (TPR) repeat protein
MATAETNKQVKRPNVHDLAIALMILTFLAYLPAMNAGFIMDDENLVTQNRLILRSDGLYRIWFTTQSTDYWPVTYTTWWLEWRLWGNNPAGYHVVNVLLHALNAVIWWRILAKLKVPGAWLAAAVFAVHPVNVESVAWISERKNTLAMFFFALTCMEYLKFDETGRSRWYWISVGTFALAMLSKAAVAPLPLVLLGFAWWRRGRIERKDWLRSLPFFAITASLTCVTVWFQYHRAIGSDIVRQDNFWSRLAGAGWAVWFYLSKASLPTNVCFVYPRWLIDPGNPLVYAPGLLVLLGLLVCWYYRHRWGRPCFAALAYYVIMLAPALGFVNIYFMRYSLVADRWQYYSIIGLIALVIGSGTAMAQRGDARRRNLGKCVASAVVILLAVTAWRQQRIYANVETLWRDTIAKNPHCRMAHLNLGNVLSQSGRTQAAIHEYEQVLQDYPDDLEADTNLGNALLQQGMPQQAIAYYERVLSINPDYAEAHANLATALLRQGKVDQAINHCQQALRIHPDYAGAHYTLGRALLQQGRRQEAITQYELALWFNPGFTLARDALARLQAGPP